MMKTYEPITQFKKKIIRKTQLCICGQWLDSGLSTVAT